MKYALNLAEDGRILSATYEKYAPENAVLVDTLPDGDISDYLYQDGSYVYDPLLVPEEPAEPKTPESESNVWDELDAAYQEGVNSVD